VWSVVPSEKLEVGLHRALGQNCPPITSARRRKPSSTVEWNIAPTCATPFRGCLLAHPHRSQRIPTPFYFKSRYRKERTSVPSATLKSPSTLRSLHRVASLTSGLLSPDGTRDLLVQENLVEEPTWYPPEILQRSHRQLKFTWVL
jgi:hypothetical protein